MARLRKPNSDAARLALLRKCVETGAQDHESGRGYLSHRTLRQIEGLIPRYASASYNVTQAVAHHRKTLLLADEAIEQLEVAIRSIWAHVQWCVRRKRVATDMLAYYKLPIRGRLPVPRTRQEWLETGLAIQAGDDQAVAAGYDSVLNRATLDAAVVEVQMVLEKVGAAKTALQATRDELSSVRQAATEVCEHIISELRHTLHRKPASFRRQVMRAYGVRFRYAPGETESGEVAVANSKETA